MEIINFDLCKTNIRNGTYGGQAGDKEGVIYHGENWIIKYPKNTKGMKGNLASYTTAPLSEYIGSHVYQILGYDVHDTLLGIRNNKLVVACKDFCKTEGALREVRTIKNVYSNELSRKIEQTISGTSSSHLVDIEELMIHLNYNPILSQVDGIKERFWNCVIIDILINNNDRNNGNWGLLSDGNKYMIAPIFDNGAAFSNKYTDEKISDIMGDVQRMKDSCIGTTTIYGYQGKQLVSKELLRINNQDLKKALEFNVPLIKKNVPKIQQMIFDIPETFEGMPICSRQRKEFYLMSMEMRMEYLLEPAYKLHENLFDKNRNQNQIPIF